MYTSIQTHYADMLQREGGMKWKKVPVLIRDKARTILDTTIEVPDHWSQQAADILAHKYLRKAGVPVATVTNNADQYEGIPTLLRPQFALDGAQTGAETRAHQVFHRLAGHWAYTASREGYLSGEDACRYYFEMYAMLYYQIAAPNSPQFFNTGLWWAYGIEGTANGSYFADTAQDDGVRNPITEAFNTYEFPQTSACFILSVQDSLLGEGGIFDTLKEEARIFKFGSGSGINFSSLRAKGAELSNGGVSSGVMSFLEIFDRGAGAIKSGGTTRRAAKMVILDAEHPEALEFVGWKAREEVKAAALLAARKTLAPTTNIARDALSRLSPDYESETYTTIGGQNANLSLRVTDAFMQDVLGARNASAHTSLWGATIEAAHACGDPGLQFHDTINAWHTCPGAGPIRASNPCSEYMFLDNTGCNLASLNLLKFQQLTSTTHGEAGPSYFDGAAFEHAVRLWTFTLDVTISMSSFPNEAIAANSHKYRTLGLGYCNLGGLLMALGVAYASEEARSIAANITSLMQAAAWDTSIALARAMGTNLNEHTHTARSVFNKHRDAHAKLSAPKGFADVHGLSTALWEEMATRNPGCVRNAQLTLLAPTGTISFIMDAATTGIEPEFALVKVKKLAGGGTMKISNPLIRPAMTQLGYTPDEINDVAAYVEANGRVDKLTPHIRVEHIPVFAAANDIPWQDHIEMMAAVQPFLSGAISKTVNMPNSASVEEVGSAYLMAWKKGLKAIAIFRDGCKLAQPLTAMSTLSSASSAESVVSEQSTSSLAGKQPTAQRTERYRLPNRRAGFTQKANVAGHNVYIRTGEYTNGQLGEIFLTISKEGSTLKQFMDALAMSVSIGLQYGVPLSEYTDAFIGTRAEPSGLVMGSETVRFCDSIIDYVFREISAAYDVNVSTHKAAVLPTKESAPPPVEAPAHTTPSLTAKVVAADEATTTVTAPPSMAEFAKEVDAEEAASGGNVRPLFVRRQLSAGTMSLSLTGLGAGYLGDACRACGSFTLKRNGTCKVCETCGETTGCS